MKKNILIFLLLTVTTTVLADGKMYWNLEKVNPEIPYQRALILHKDSTETLFLQSKYSFPEATNEKPEDIGWIVPLPSVPEIATMDAHDAFWIYFWLSKHSSPKITKIRIFLWLAFLVIYLIITIKLMIKQRKNKEQVLPRNSISGIIARITLITFIIFLLISMLMPALGTAGHSGVDIVKAKTVGIYDIKVIRSDSADDLISWLNENEFQFDQNDKVIFDNYIAKGWCFVTATINAKAEDKEEHEIVSEGLAAPLILRFESEKAIYPMALTGTGGFDTEVLIYLATDSKMTCGEQMTLRYALQNSTSWIFRSHFEKENSSSLEPIDFFTQKDFDTTYLCKFKDILTPAQMKEDIVFTPAPDNEPYREHIVQW